MDIEFLKKLVVSKSKNQRKAAILSGHIIPLYRQCELLCLHRTCIYYRYKPTPEAIIKKENDEKLMGFIDALHVKQPTLGARTIATMISEQGHPVKRGVI